MAVIQDRKVGVKINFLQVSVQNRHETTRPRYILIKLTYHIETTQIWTSIELNFLNLTNMVSNHGFPNLEGVLSLTFLGFPDKIDRNSLTFSRCNFGFWGVCDRCFSQGQRWGKIRGLWTRKWLLLTRKELMV